MSINKRTLIKSAVAMLALAFLVFGVMRALSARKAQSEALAAASTATSQSVVELAPTDVLKLQTLDVAQGLPISGTLKAVNS
ncbi:MAG: efflux transporter periplasmic adaptor subunit, partial [Polaromonas sp.]|nr:efflux transporter periplasmic adaptor subunit [Polaromonas sp.]